MKASAVEAPPKVPRPARSFRYLVAAGMNTVFGLAIYPVLLWSFPVLQRHYMTGLLIAQALSLCFAYANYKIGVFRTRGRYAREITAFTSFYLVNYVVNWGALPLLVEFGNLSPIIAQLLFSFVIVVGSYFWHSRVTFRDAQ